MKSSSFGELLLLGALWGAAFMFMRVAVPEFGAVPMAATRIGLACLIMLLIVAVMRQPFAFRTHWKTYLAVGAVNTAIPFVAYSFAAQHIPAGYSAIGNSTTPVWGALIAWLWFKEPLGPLKWLGIGFAFAGVLVLVGLQPVALTPLVIAGMLAVVLAAAMYATASFLIKRYLSDQSGFSGATGMVWGAAMWLLLPGLWLAPHTMPSAQAWGAVAALSLFCTVAGYALFFRLIRTIGPQRASSVAFLFPAFAAFWGWLILSEPITFNMVMGMAFVLAGTALVSMQTVSSGPTTAWERLRDSQIVPFLFAALAPLRRPIARWVRGNPRLYRNEADAVRQHLHLLLPDADVEAAVADHRFTRLADHADMWLYRLYGVAWYRRNVRVDIADGEHFGPGFYIGHHFGGCWWIAGFLRERGIPAAAMFWDSEWPSAWLPRLLRRVAQWRVDSFSELLTAPPHYTHKTRKGVAWQMIGNWRKGISLVALVDVPPPLVDRTATIRFFDRDAEFPPSVIDLALRQRQPVWMFGVEWQPDTLQPMLRVRRLEADSAGAVLQQCASELEAMIRRRPGAWHLWGDMPLFFPHGS